VNQKERIRISDAFTRADSNVSLGRAPTGQAWTVTSQNSLAVFGIESNRAKIVTLDGAYRCEALLQSGLADCVIYGTFAVATALQRLVFRWTDYFQQFYIHYETGQYKLVDRGGGGGVLGAFTMAQANGDYFKVILRGTSIKVYINGTLRFDVTSSAHLLGTIHGIECYQDLTPRWDDFKVERL
jgi:hypothetical protein